VMGTNGGNQDAASLLTDMLDTLPPVQHAFAYGSGIFKQPGAAALQEGAACQLDLMLAVDFPRRWHEANLRQNPKHYRGATAWGAGATVAVADGVGVGVHFNTHVPFNGALVKYGVVRTERLVKDLSTWEELYVAGRMQKPVLTLVEDPRVRDAQESNKASALAAAMLLLPKRFSETDLFRMICGLSYAGDVRMAFMAEDLSKVDNLARGSAEHLRVMYADVVKRTLPPIAEGADYVQDKGAAATQERLVQLPRRVLALIARGRASADPATLAAAALDRGQGDMQAELQRVLGRAVGRASLRQAIAGALSQGIPTAGRYLYRKMVLAFSSWRKRHAV